MTGIDGQRPFGGDRRTGDLGTVDIIMGPVSDGLSAPVPGLYVWHRADQLVTTDTGGVSAWGNLISGNPSATQGASGDRPDTGGALGGQASLVFNGSTDELDMSLATGSADDLGVAYVLDEVSSGTATTYFSLNQVTGNNVRIFRSGGGSWRYDVGAGTVNFGTANYVEQYVVANFVSGGNVNIRRNGVDITTSGAMASGIQLSSAALSSIGSNGGGSLNANAEYAEFMIKPGGFTAGDITALEAYFAARYGI